MSEPKRPRTWDNEHLALEAWKYCGGIGGSDKDRMIQIVTWLLGFSAAIIAFQAKDELKHTSVTILGIVVSIAAAYVALLYGAYAAWNWGIADEIAKPYNWRELRPDHDPTRSSKAGWQRTLIRRLAKPCHGRIAPVFWAFFGFSLVSAVIHCVLLWCAFKQVGHS
jgi:hypothetical protein